MDFPHLSKVFLDNNFNFLVLKLGWGFLVPICIIFLLVFAQTNKFVWSYSILEIYFFFCIFETQLIWGKTLIMVALMIHLRSPEERQNPEGLRSSDHHRGNPRPPPDAIRWSEHQDTRVSLVGCIIFPFFFFWKIKLHERPGFIFYPSTIPMIFRCRSFAKALKYTQNLAQRYSNPQDVTQALQYPSIASYD